MRGVVLVSQNRGFSCQKGQQKPHRRGPSCVLRNATQAIRARIRGNGFPRRRVREGIHAPIGGGCEKGFTHQSDSRAGGCEKGFTHQSGTDFRNGGCEKGFTHQSAVGARRDSRTNRERISATVGARRDSRTNRRWVREGIHAPVGKGFTHQSGRDSRTSRWVREGIHAPVGGCEKGFTHQSAVGKGFTHQSGRDSRTSRPRPERSGRLRRRLSQLRHP